MNGRPRKQNAAVTDTENHGLLRQKRTELPANDILSSTFKSILWLSFFPGEAAAFLKEPDVSLMNGLF